jgi:hypothetical protein
MNWHDLIAYIMTPTVAVLWYLLRQKDDKQAGEIQLLFKKHDQDAEELKQLRLKIAEDHYKRGELDTRFDKLEGTIKSSFGDLGSKFDKLSEALLKHVQYEVNHQQQLTRRHSDISCNHDHKEI